MTEGEEMYENIVNLP